MVEQKPIVWGDVTLVVILQIICRCVYEYAAQSSNFAQHNAAGAERRQIGVFLRQEGNE